MSWKKYFKNVNHAALAQAQALHGGMNGSQKDSSSKFSSFLPDIYAGHPNRIQRYYQYEDMARDSDISAALDTIADFCTQSEEQNENPFQINYKDASETEVKLINQAMDKWVKLNGFKRKLWKMFRDCAQNGDAVFIRDPETHKWLWVDPYAVEAVRLADDGTKEPVEYIIQNFDPNLTASIGTGISDMSRYRNPGMAAGSNARPMTSTASQFQLAGQERDMRNNHLHGTDFPKHVAIKAEDIVHLSLNEGMDNNYPFGKSVLDPIFKTYKQKELLEDAIIIYRVQRAPERRVFYIDVGTMNGVRAQTYIEGIKNEIHQRRIPNKTGGGSNIMDAAYSPLGLLDDYFFAQSADGRGSKVETLPSGDQLGEITDLSFFTKKMARGLRIPTSYLSLGDEDGQAAYNDGKLGQALIQEFRFNKYCMRLQSLLCPSFDRSFKDYVERSGIEVDEDVFELEFNPPQNFTKYRQMEIDAQQTQVYSAVAGNPYLAERWKLKRYLNMTEEEILENEELLQEENPDMTKVATGSTPAEATPDGDLSSIGIRPPGDDFSFDSPDMPDEGMGDDAGATGPEGGEPAGGAPAGGAGGAAAAPGIGAAPTTQGGNE